MFDIDIEVDMADTMKTLEGMKARALNFIVPLEIARQRLAKANAANFMSGGAVSGGWKPREEPEPWPILRKTGTLMESLSSLVGPPNRVEATEATFGTDVKYAKFHEFGTFEMPSREIVFEPSGFARQVAQDAVNHVLGLEIDFR